MSLVSYLVTLVTGFPIASAVSVPKQNELSVVNLPMNEGLWFTIGKIITFYLLLLAYKNLEKTSLSLVYLGLGVVLGGSIAFLLVGTTTYL